MKLHEARDPWLRNAKPRRERLSLADVALAAFALYCLVSVAQEWLR